VLGSCAVRVRWRCGAKQTKIRSKQRLGVGAMCKQGFGAGCWCGAGLSKQRFGLVLVLANKLSNQARVRVLGSMRVLYASKCLVLGAGAKQTS